MILLIDDDENFLALMQDYLSERHPGLSVLACNDPIACLGKITPDLDLLLVDLEMPGLDGAKVLSYATSIGLSKNRVVILSAHEAAYLHERFPMGSCLAVLNKHEAKQREVLDMIFGQLEKKRNAPDP